MKYYQEIESGEYCRAVETALAEMDAARAVERLWQHDHTLWKPEPTEIANRLGWLHVAAAMRPPVPALEALARQAQADGYTDVLLLGMGGSSLAPELFGRVFGQGRLRLAVLDSTDPGAVLAHTGRLEPACTLFIVSTKSGGTVETASFFKFFYRWTVDALGSEAAGAHWVAITDPGSQLAEWAEQYHFRTTFLNDPNIGGRYSALSYFGLVPAALVGVDLDRLLDRALAAAGECAASAAAENPGAHLGAVLGELARAGRNKVTFVISPPIASFGDWVEQLIAESTGKDGRGIVPVVDEPLGPPEVYGDDRLFVHLRLAGDAADDAALAALTAAGQPLLRYELDDVYDLGGQFFLWEFATAVAGHRLEINPFDQPDVEAAKALARKAVTAYTATGTLPTEEVAAPTAEALRRFLAQARPGDYIALQAYVCPDEQVTAALRALRLCLRQRTRLATTVGYGPRFLHSTGQLHKGDNGSGLFIQFTAEMPHDVSIPDKADSPASSMTFGVLKTAQALGDAQALRQAGRRLLRFHLGQDVAGELMALTRALEEGR